MMLDQVVLIITVTCINILLILTSFIVIFKRHNQLSLKNLIPGIASKKLLDMADIKGLISYIYIGMQFTVVSLLIRYFYNNIKLFFDLGSYDVSEVANTITSDYAVLMVLIIPYIFIYMYVMYRLRNKFTKNNKTVSIGKFLFLMFLDLYIYDVLLIYFAFNNYKISSDI